MPVDPRQPAPTPPKDWDRILREISSGEDSDAHDGPNWRAVQQRAPRVAELVGQHALDLASGMPPLVLPPQLPSKSAVKAHGTDEGHKKPAIDADARRRVDGVRSDSVDA